jgi:hypothetical protein
VIFSKIYINFFDIIIIIIIISLGGKNWELRIHKLLYFAHNWKRW